MSPCSASAVAGEKWISVRPACRTSSADRGRDLGDLGLGGRDDVLDAAGDEAPLHLMRLPAAADVGPAAQHVPHDRADQRHIGQIRQA